MRMVAITADDDAFDGGGLSMDEERAFNLGCDARLVGLPLVANPFPASDASLHRFWVRGWEHVNICWGTGARTWSVKPLPPIGFAG